MLPLNETVKFFSFIMVEKLYAKAVTVGTNNLFIMLLYDPLNSLGFSRTGGAL